MVAMQMQDSGILLVREAGGRLYVYQAIDMVLTLHSRLRLMACQDGCFSKAMDRIRVDYLRRPL
ncbi:hypothetical protein A9975_15535 [Cupriavidus sp. UME77]|nr:hypothetical protein [Cupriavidus sp. UME77]